MPQKPQRPFVPHRTPPERPGADRPTEFRIAPPFVHGTGNRSPAESVPSISDFLRSESPPPVPAFLTPESHGPISDYMSADSPASISDFLAPESSFETSTGGDGSEYELPPIEHFTDSPSEEGALAADDNLETDSDPFGYSGAEQSNTFGWEETDWQRYDWRSAAALGETTDPEASSAWAQTDWGNAGAPPPPPPPPNAGETAAKAIADALDGIARRIRDGDAPDPATIAATLAALLGVRR